MTEKTGEPARTWHNSNVSCYLPRDSPHRFGARFSACVDLRKRAHLEDHGVGVAAIQLGCIPNLATKKTQQNLMHIKRKAFNMIILSDNAGLQDLVSPSASFINIKPEPGGSGMNSPVNSLAYISWVKRRAFWGSVTCYVHLQRR